MINDSSSQNEQKIFDSPQFKGNDFCVLDAEDELFLFSLDAQHAIKNQGEEKYEFEEDKVNPRPQDKKKEEIIKGRLQKSNKIKKEKIRSKNAYKAAHDILINWCKTNGMERNIKKYSYFYSRRIYFPLVLYEIQKNCKEDFAQIYEELTQTVIKKKILQKNIAANIDSSSTYVKHLDKFVSELKFTIDSCREFMSGNIRESITIVHRRERKEIYRYPDYLAAIQDFQEETGQAVDQ